jgi:hypothetical protein
MRVKFTPGEAKALAFILRVGGDEFGRHCIDVEQTGMGLSEDEARELTASMHEFMKAKEMLFDARKDWRFLFRLFETRVREALSDSILDAAEQAVLDAMATAEERDLNYYSCFRDGWKQEVAEAELTRREAKKPLRT